VKQSFTNETSLRFEIKHYKFNFPLATGNFVKQQACQHQSGSLIESQTESHADSDEFCYSSAERTGGGKHRFRDHSAKVRITTRAMKSFKLHIKSSNFCFDFADQS
jgi:hypothetical protein